MNRAEERVEVGERIDEDGNVQKLYCTRKKRYDAKDWGEFLELNGFRSLKESRPWVGYVVSFRDAYIGINPKVGEYGQLYWLLSMDRAGKYVCASDDEYSSDEIGYVCTTYQDFKPLTCWIARDDPNITWYEYAGTIFSNSFRGV